MKISTVSFFILIALISCRELVQEDFPEFLAVPTVNSILIADSTFKVHVSLADKIDTNQLPVNDNATVILYVDGQFREALTYFENGVYSSITIIEPQKTYDCEVNIPGYQTVYCNDIIPDPVTISDIVHIKKAGMDREGLTYPAIQFTFTNNPEEELYFEAVIRLIKYGYEQTAELLFITDPVLLNEGLPVALFSNELISGESYTMTINYTTGSGSSGGTNLYPLILEFRTVSRNYYQYVKQLVFYEQGRYPDQIGSPLTVASLFSNINEGYGIFAGFSFMQSDTIYPN